MNASKQTGHACSVLVVDDDPISRELLALLLTSEGHRVTKAASGKEALNALAQAAPLERPGAILVDLRMPGLSGGKLAQHLRRQAGTGVRILAMSASEPTSIAQFDGFLRKPVDVAALASMLGGGPRTAAAASAEPEDRHPAILKESIYIGLRSMMPAESVDEIFEVCIQDTRRRIPEMTAWLQAGEREPVRQAAHTIKGGSSMIGAARISEIAAKLELGSYEPGEGFKFLVDLSSACGELERILLGRKAGTPR